MAVNKFVIIGGGAAGIAAAYTILQESEQNYVELFEAKSDYGGRAHTDSTTIRGLPFDMGAVYLQDPANNPWTAIAAELGFETVEDDTAYIMRIDRGEGYEDVVVGSDPDVNAVVATIDASYEQNRTEPNLPVMTKPRLDTLDEWFGLATSTYGPFTEAAEPWQYLAADRARESQGPGDRFVTRGLGTLVASYGRGLSTKFGARYTERLNKPVGSITVTPDSVTVTSTDGYVIVPADACVVTVPVDVLAKGTIQFSPQLPEGRIQALRAVRLGAYKKLAVQLASLPTGIEDNTNYYLYNEAPEGIWQVYRLSSYPLNVLVAHASGDFAAALDEIDDSAVYRLLGNALSQAYATDVHFRSTKAITNWSRDPQAGGAYSYTAFIGGGPQDPTSLEARRRLSVPLGRMFFAGEAQSLTAYGTLQGAYWEGESAAKAAIAALRAGSK